MSTESHTKTYTVDGMTCGHCVSSVTEQVAELPGVVDVRVVLETGRVTVTSDAPLGQEQVRTAVELAGYALVGQPTTEPGPDASPTPSTRPSGDRA